jgi:hypothetical protein
MNTMKDASATTKRRRTALLTSAAAIVAALGLGAASPGQADSQSPDAALERIRPSGYLQDRDGEFTRITVPGARVGTAATDINDHGQIVGFYVNPDAAPDRQPSPMGMPMMMMSDF